MFKQYISLNSYLKYCKNNHVAKRVIANSSWPIQNQIDIVQKFLGCTKEKAVESLCIHEELLQLPGDELNRRLSILQEFGVADVADINWLGLAKHHSSTLKNRIMSLQECGFNETKINSSVVQKFLTLTHLQIQTLKELLLIDRESDVYKHLLHYAELIDLHYSSTSDKDNIKTLKIQMIRLLLKQEINITDQTLDERPEILKRLKNKSIRVIRKNIEIAKTILGISSVRICRHPYLLWADPDNTLRVIKEIKELGGIDITLWMALFPKIVLPTYENTMETKNCLKEYEFSNLAIQRAIGIFTLSSKNVRNRLLDLEQEEVFRSNKHHSRILLLVYYYKRFKMRLALLKEINVNNAPMNTLSSSNQKLFDKFYSHGPSKQGGNDIITYICTEIDCKSLAFRNKIRGCVFWRHVPTVEIAKNLKYLRDLGFNNKDIFDNLHALFYPKNRLVEELALLSTREGLEDCKDNGVIRNEFVLPLIVYFIEKSFNFSSHSIFIAETENMPTHSDIAIPDYAKTIS